MNRREVSRLYRVKNKREVSRLYKRFAIANLKASM